MMITAREKSIIDLMVKQSGKHTIASIAEILHVSSRTIQRDLKSIETVLKRFDLSIENTNGLSIIGANQNFYQFIQEVNKLNLIDFSIEERRLLAYIKLINAEGPIKLAPLAKELGVSITTLSTDLEELADWLKSYDLTLYRRKGVGVEIEGLEEDKRNALVSYLLINFNEELIENLFLLTQKSVQKGEVLFFLKKDYLKIIDKIVYQYINETEIRLADSDYISFIIHICISLQRTEKGFSLSNQNSTIDELKNSEEYALLINVRNELKNYFSISLNDYEITYLVSILKGSKIIELESTYYDQILISRSVKKMIHDVSKQLNVDLSGDFSLFQGLMAHMEPTIYRMSKGLTHFNPLTDEIKQKYPLLFLAVQTSVNNTFANMSFSDDEIAYIVLHFGSALELKKEEVQIHALIICPTGIGTSKMLASRIKKEIPEITTTEIITLKEMDSIDWKQYEIVISTVLLPVQEGFEYVFVNPLLYEKDIELIQTYLGSHIQQITKHSAYPADNKWNEINKTNKNKTTLHSFMEEIDIYQNSIRTILKNFSIHRMKNEPTYDLLLWKMLEKENEKGSITNVEEVFLQLKQREAKGGLGIPETNMALFHCRHDKVKEITFQIGHLENPYKLLGMNGAEMEVYNILLLLAPQALNDFELEIISMVSTIIVENKENILIFSSANERLIRTKLEDAFLHLLQNKFGRE